jgi:DNA-binding LacI/PurR family transcriptional regulator
MLVKEGLVERMEGTGTYVTERQNRFTCAGIYHGADIFSVDQSPFGRALHTALLAQFQRMKKETQVFIDSRPVRQQGTLLPALEEAVLHRRIQCLIAPTINPVCAPALRRLGMPTAFPQAVSFKVARSTPEADEDKREFLRESVRRLAAQGCRSVGLIANIMTPPDSKRPDFYAFFREAVRAEKLTLRNEWIRKPVRAGSIERYGYHAFKTFWNLPHRPDGVIVYPDMGVRGAITAILEIGINVVTPQLKFVFHRNRQHDLLCPFPATWAILDEEVMARTMIELVERQFQGKEISPILFPCQFEDSDGTV